MFTARYHLRCWFPWAWGFLHPDLPVGSVLLDMVRQWFIGKGSIRRLIERSPVFPRVGGTRLIEFSGAVIVSTLVAGVREIEFSISQRRGSLSTTTRVDGFFSLSSVSVLSRSRVSVVVSLATRVEVGGSSCVILRVSVVYLVSAMLSLTGFTCSFLTLETFVHNCRSV